MSKFCVIPRALQHDVLLRRCVTHFFRVMGPGPAAHPFVLRCIRDDAAFAIQSKRKQCKLEKVRVCAATFVLQRARDDAAAQAAIETVSRLPSARAAASRRSSRVP